MKKNRLRLLRVAIYLHKREINMKFFSRISCVWFDYSVSSRSIDDDDDENICQIFISIVEYDNDYYK